MPLRHSRSTIENDESVPSAWLPRWTSCAGLTRPEVEGLGARMVNFAIPLHLLAAAVFATLSAFFGQWLLAALFLLLVASLLPLRASFVERHPLLAAQFLLHSFTVVVVVASLGTGPVSRLDVLLLHAIVGSFLLCPTLSLSLAGASALVPAGALVFLHAWGYGHFPSVCADQKFLASSSILAIVSTASLILVPLLALFRGTRVERRTTMRLLEKESSSSQSKSRFLAKSGRELRTSLSGMMGALELVAGEELGYQQREHLDLAFSMAAMLRAIVDDMFEFSRQEEGCVVLERRSVRLQAELPRMLHPCRLLSEAKGVAMHADIAEDLPRLLIDVDRFRQILFHVVGNAVKFTSKGSIDVSLTQGPAVDEGQVELVLVVRDTGIGMTEERRCRLLRTSLHSTGEAGSGKEERAHLGFELAWRLVESMNGDLDIQSGPGEGTSLRIRLRCEKAHPDEPSFLETSKGERSRILLVEDEPVNRVVATKLLRQDGFDVVAVCDGEQGVDLWARDAFPVILMDCELPGKDGYAATREIRLRERREGRPRTLILAYTAGTLGVDRRRCEECGMDGVLAKPLSRRELREALERRHNGGH